MNRAEKRRQKKLAGKAAKKVQSIQVAQSTVQSTQAQQNMAIEQAIELGLQHHNAGDLSKAEGIYQQILQVEANQPVALHFLGIIAYQLNKNDIAIDLIGKALAIKPDYADAHNNLGNTLKEQGKLDDAVASYLKAINIKPDNAEAHNNLGNTLKEQGKLDDAVESYYQALAIKSDYAEVHYNLGIALKVQGKMHDAVASYRNAIAIKPDYASAIYNLGDAFQEQGKWDDAVENYSKAIELKPDKDGWHIRKALTLPVIFSSSDEVQKTRLELMDRIKVMQSRTLSVVNPLEDIGLTNFDLAYHNKNNKNILENIARLHLSACPKLAYEADHCSPIYNRKKGRLRIGFLSLFLKNHTIGKLYKGIVEHFSKDQFEVIFFQPTGTKDEVSGAISHSVDKVVPLHNKLEQDRESIASEELDILFYPDIGMAPYTYFLSFSRLAPIQVVSWGHPDTTGIHNIDYFLSSELIELEDTSNQYTEQLVLLSLMPTFYYRPKPPPRAYCRADYNLPETGALYVCPQALFKLHPDFDLIIANLLRKDHRGFLVLINDNVGGQHKNLIMKRFQATFPDVSDRVIFVPRMDRNKYLGLTILADAMLDVPSFSGGNSSLEAFAMSVPIVTWPGGFMRSRVTAGYYAQMGLKELIASNAENYLEIAYKLAHDGTFKNHMHGEIKENSHKLYERMEVVREMEAFFIEAHKSWQKGEILSNEVFREVLDIK
jgi:protein O-GlcNAc transferase